jgi:hypothetical protein
MSEHSQHDADVTFFDDPEMGSTWFVTIATIIMFAVSVLAISAMYFGFEDGEVEVKIVDAPAEAFQEMRLSQQEVLTEYGRYDIEDADGNTISRIRIPISRAVEAELAAAKTRAALDTEEAVATR